MHLYTNINVHKTKVMLEKRLFSGNIKLFFNTKERKKLASISINMNSTILIPCVHVRYIRMYIFLWWRRLMYPNKEEEKLLNINHIRWMYMTMGLLCHISFYPFHFHTHTHQTLCTLHNCHYYLVYEQTYIGWFEFLFCLIASKMVTKNIFSLHLNNTNNCTWLSLDTFMWRKRRRQK